jgi:hypothetical protein
MGSVGRDCIVCVTSVAAAAFWPDAAAESVKRLQVERCR